MTDKQWKELLETVKAIECRLAALEARPVYAPQIVLGPPPERFRPGNAWTTKPAHNTATPLPNRPVTICDNAETDFYSYPGDSGHTLTR